MNVSLEARLEAFICKYYVYKFTAQRNVVLAVYLPPSGQEMNNALEENRNRAKIFVCSLFVPIKVDIYKGNCVSQVCHFSWRYINVVITPSSCCPQEVASLCSSCAIFSILSFFLFCEKPAWMHKVSVEVLMNSSLWVGNGFMHRYCEYTSFLHLVPDVMDSAVWKTDPVILKLQTSSVH